MKVTHIMTTNVECIAPDTTLEKAAQLMKDLDVGFLPVLDNDRLVGTITDRDIAIRSVAEGHDVRKTTARDIMSTQVFYCYDDQDISECGHSMQDQSVRRMLVLDRKKNLVGVVSLGDLAAKSEAPLAGKTLKHISEAA
jgi:CBS domain-containing protein